MKNKIYIIIFIVFNASCFPPHEETFLSNFLVDTSDASIHKITSIDTSFFEVFTDKVYLLNSKNGYTNEGLVYFYTNNNNFWELNSFNLKTCSVKTHSTFRFKGGNSRNEKLVDFTIINSNLLLSY